MLIDTKVLFASRSLPIATFLSRHLVVVSARACVCVCEPRSIHYGVVWQIAAATSHRMCGSQLKLINAFRAQWIFGHGECERVCACVSVLVECWVVCMRKIHDTTFFHDIDFARRTKQNRKNGRKRKIVSLISEHRKGSWETEMNQILFMKNKSKYWITQALG